MEVELFMLFPVEVGLPSVPPPRIVISVLPRAMALFGSFELARTVAIFRVARKPGPALWPSVDIVDIATVSVDIATVSAAAREVRGADHSATGGAQQEKLRPYARNEP